MLNIILNGCNGRMGQVLTRIIGEKDDMQVVAGIDAHPDQKIAKKILTILTK